MNGQTVTTGEMLFQNLDIFVSGIIICSVLIFFVIFYLFINNLSEKTFMRWIMYLAIFNFFISPLIYGLAIEILNPNIVFLTYYVTILIIMVNVWYIAKSKLKIAKEK